MKRARTAVIGLGNYLLADEGAGLHACEMLEQKVRGMDVDVLEIGVCGMNLLHQFEGREKIIFVDAGNCGMKPGEYLRFRPHEVISRKEAKRISLHDFDLIQFLDYADHMAFTTTVDIIIYCIQAASVKAGSELSPPVRDSLPILVENIYNEIQETAC